MGAPRAHTCWCCLRSRGGGWLSAQPCYRVGAAGALLALLLLLLSLRLSASTTHAQEKANIEQKEGAA